MVNLTGLKFNRLTVLKYSHTAKKKIYWECKCSCGNVVIVQTSGLKNGHTKSCGCLRKEISRKTMAGINKNNAKGHNTRTYTTWYSMVSRCNNPKHGSYKKYGAKGIRVCERWLNFKDFLLDMGERPEGSSIDRIDNSKGYEPSNCRWTTPSIQSINRNVMACSKSGYSGVVWHKGHNKWESYITIKRKKIHIGYYDDIDLAVKARNQYITDNHLNDYKLQ